jgi:hypothetical protein
MNVPVTKVTKPQKRKFQSPTAARGNKPKPMNAAMSSSGSAFERKKSRRIEIAKVGKFKATPTAQNKSRTR